MTALLQRTGAPNVFFSRLKRVARGIGMSLIFAGVLVDSAAAATEVDLARISAMDQKQLDQLVGSVSAAIVQESLQLSSLAEKGQCAELYKAGNALALGYDTLGAIDKLLSGKTGVAPATTRSAIVQSRVVGFASRVRAEELTTGACRHFVLPSELASDPRYDVPVRLRDRDFARAIIDARISAETNIAVAATAQKSKDCKQVGVAIRSIQLAVPYYDKLSKDVADRPLALGPLASKRGLELVRNQSVLVANALDRQFSATCDSAAGAANVPAQGSEKSE